MEKEKAFGGRQGESWREGKHCCVNWLTIRYLVVLCPIWNLWFCNTEAKGGATTRTKMVLQMCIQMSLAEHPSSLTLGIRRGLLVTSNGAKQSPSYMCMWGYFLSFFLNMIIMTLEEWQTLFALLYFLMIFILHSYIGIKANFLLKGVIRTAEWNMLKVR